MAIQDVINKPQRSKSDFSINDTQDMFLGAIISGKVDPEEILKIKKDYCTTEVGKSVFEIIHRGVEAKNWVDYL